MAMDATAPGPTDEKASKPSRPSRRIFAFSVIIALGACSIALRLARSTPVHGAFFDSWWGLGILTLLFALSELMVVHLEVGRSAHTVSVVEVTFVVALFNASPIAGLTAHVVGAALVLIVHRRQRLTKLFFNLSMFALENQLAYYIFRLFPQFGGRGIAPRTISWPAAYLAAAAFTLSGIVLVFGVIYLAEQELSLRKLLETARISLINSTIMASVGITASALLATSPETALLLVIPIAGAYVTNKTFLRERRRIEDLEFLKESSQQLNGEDVAEHTMWAVLEAARVEFRVELIDYEYREGVGLPWRRVSLRRGEEPSVVTLDDAILARYAPSAAVLVTGGSSGSDGSSGVGPAGLNPLAREIASRNLGSVVVVAPVRVANEIEGVLLIAQPSTDVISFGQSDLRLAEMLTAQLASATETGRLGQSVAELRKLESRLVFELQHDTLTGILNRSAFVRRVREALVTERRLSAVLFLDLDDFKPINDTYGHAVGDLLLQALADRIQASIRPDDLACRLGGDEFAVFLGSVTSPEEATAAAQRILLSMGQPFEVSDGEFVNPAASIGLALTAPDDTAESAIERADNAMFRAKHQGKGQIELSDPTINQTEARAAFELAREFKGAASREELDLVFQSVHRLDGHEVVAYEGLARWNHPRLGLLSPDRFMPTGVHADVQRELRRFVSVGALNALEVLGGLGFHGSLSVNLAAGQALDDTLLEDISTLFERDGVEPDRLLIEIPETAFLRSSVTMLRRVKELQAAGAGIVLDDLSLDKLTIGMIEQLKPNLVKLSRVLVSELGIRPSASPFVRSVTELGQTLGYEVTAKGIEDLAAVELARQVGCQLGQGYYFAQPMTLASITSQAEMFDAAAR
jgi:diguanylate cyclase (GGDEF)-like protein